MEEKFTENILKHRQCQNCGANLKAYPDENGVIKCPYCETEYYYDSYLDSGFQVVRLNIYGKERKFYISEIEENTIWGEITRPIDDTMEQTPITITRKLKCQLIEM